MIKKGANINKANMYKYTALHFAVVNMYVEAVELLLMNGAESTEDINGDTPLDTAEN